MKDYLEKLITGYLANAREYLTEDNIAEFYPGRLDSYLRLSVEAIPVEHLADINLIRHAIHKLDEYSTPEETMLHTFLLYMHKLCIESSKHPLEQGIIKQKVHTTLPHFKRYFDQGLIPRNDFERNVDALMHMAEQTAELTEILSALNQEYTKYANNS
jgi:hypothetical protein